MSKVGINQYQISMTTGLEKIIIAYFEGGNAKEKGQAEIQGIIEMLRDQEKKD